MSEVALLIEGTLEEYVGRRILVHAGLTPGPAYGKSGWSYVRDHIKTFNASADYRPILALVDLMDTGEECAATVVANWLPHRRPNMVFRLPRPEVESWLLADRAGFAAFLGIRPQFVPMNPDALDDAKQEVMRLAARSRRTDRRTAILPRHGYSASQGPLYTAELGLFTNSHWDIAAASASSESLHSALRRVTELAATLAP